MLYQQTLQLQQGENKKYFEHFNVSVWVVVVSEKRLRSGLESKSNSTVVSPAPQPGEGHKLQNKSVSRALHRLAGLTFAVGAAVFTTSRRPRSSHRRRRPPTGPCSLRLRSLPHWGGGRGREEEDDEGSETVYIAGSGSLVSHVWNVLACCLPRDCHDSINKYNIMLNGPRSNIGEVEEENLPGGRISGVNIYWHQIILTTSKNTQDVYRLHWIGKIHNLYDKHITHTHVKLSLIKLRLFCDIYIVQIICKYSK